ncbi:MAG: hypothetical protein PHC60_05975 [Heliobacteriaceae bacterium]|nr:hypothetical protein [Heliobacteriaceae bacterium]
MDFTPLNRALTEICANCDLAESAGCRSRRCLTGFARTVVDYYQVKGALNIPGAEGVIPKNDLKVYDKDLVAVPIAETCKLCKQCRDNHTDDCVIALVRSSLEIAFWGESLTYPGNILEYVTLVRERDPELAGYILANYRK